jgi:cobalt-zinc-cadmium efflux system outer membrane protein
MYYPARLPAIPVLVAIAAAGGSTRAHAQDNAAFAKLSLRQAVDRALAKNPLVVTSALEVRRAEGAARGLAGVLADNPLFTAEAGYRRDQGLEGLQGSFAGRLEQPLDLLGQAGARKQAGADLVSLAKARLNLARSEIVARTRILYVAAQVARARIALSQERLEAARKTAEALELRVRLGASSDIDLRMAQAEVGRAESAIHDAQAQVIQDQWALRELLDLPASEAAHVTDVLSPPSDASASPSDADDQAILARHDSVLTVEKRQLAIDSEIVRLERERLPRLSLGLAAERPSSQERFLGLAFSVSPALWRRNQGPIAEARVERERADVERATTLAGLTRRLSAVRQELAQRREELVAVERTLAHEEEVRTLVRAGWQAGKFDFLRVLLAERSVADTKEARLALWALLWNDVIDIERLLGKGP